MKETTFEVLEALNEAFIWLCSALFGGLLSVYLTNLQLRSILGWWIIGSGFGIGFFVGLKYFYINKHHKKKDESQKTNNQS